MIYYQINEKKAFPSDMLSYLVIHNNSVTTVYMEAISIMKCQFFQFYMDQYLIQQYKKMISEIRVSINLTILQLIFILWESKNSQHEMLDNRENKKTICYQERLFPQKYDGGLIQNTYTYLHEYIKSYITLVTTNLLMKSCNYMG